jgi:hypothetical protein
MSLRQGGCYIHLKMRILSYENVGGMMGSSVALGRTERAMEVRLVGTDVNVYNSLPRYLTGLHS